MALTNITWKRATFGVKALEESSIPPLHNAMQELHQTENRFSRTCYLVFIVCLAGIYPFLCPEQDLVNLSKLIQVLVSFIQITVSQMISSTYAAGFRRSPVKPYPGSLWAMAELSASGL